MTPPKIAKTQLLWLNRINVGYAVLGILLLTQINGAGAWKSFVLGWLISIANLEILKKLGTMLVTVFEGGALHPIFYVFLFGKFAFWGLVVALFSTLPWIQAIPFAFGMSTLLVSGLGLGVRESIYAR